MSDKDETNREAEGVDDGDAGILDHPHVKAAHSYLKGRMSTSAKVVESLYALAFILLPIFLLCIWSGVGVTA